MSLPCCQLRAAIRLNLSVRPMPPFLRRLGRNIWTDVRSLASHVDAILSSKRAAFSFFKGGVALLTATLLALAGGGQFLYQQDIEAHKSRYEIEAVIGAPLTKETDCSKLPRPNISQCRLAIYQSDTLSSSLKLFLSIYQLLFYTGIFLISLSAITYFSYALRRPPA